MNEYQALMRYIVSEALRVMVGEVSATGGANTGGGDTFKMTPGEGFVTPNAFRGKKRKAKKEAIKEADDTAYPKDVRSLGTHAPALGQVPAGYSGDIEAMKKNLGIEPQDKVISTKRGGRNNPYALAHWLKRKGIAPTHTPIPAHEPQQALPGELDRQATIDREARLRAQAAERGQLDPATGKLRRGRPKRVVPTEAIMQEKAPPGMEDTVMALKKKFPKDQAFKIAWSMYNKKNEVVTDFHSVECPKCHGKEGGCDLCGNSGEVSPSTASKWRHAQTNEAKDGKASIKVKTSDTEHLPTVVVYGKADVEEAVVKDESAETDMEFADRILQRASPQTKPKPEPKKTKVNELSPDLLHKAAGMRGAQGQAAHKIAKQLNKGQKASAVGSDYSTGKFVGHYDVPNTFFKKATKLRQHAYDKTGKNEVAPEGWEDTVKAMKKHKDIENPWALAHYMKSKGYKSHK